MKNIPDSITKRILWRYVNKQINRSIHHYHVFSVISILFDEIINDLKDGKKIKIFNFGTLSLNQLKSRKYFHFIERVVKRAPAYKILRFKLSDKLSNELRNHIDIDFKG